LYRKGLGYIMNFLMRMTIGSLFFLMLNTPTYSQPKPLVVLTESDLNNQSLYDVWVEFTDKNVLSKTLRKKILATLEENFNPRALARRKKKRTIHGLFDERDFPLVSKYLLGVTETGAKIKVKSKWLNGVSILAKKEQILKIKNLPYVKNIVDFHEHKPRPKLKTKPKESLISNTNSSSAYGRSERQVNQLGLDKLHKAGYNGNGIIIAVIDCGFDISHEAFKNSEYPLDVIAQWDFVENDDNVNPRHDIHPDNYDHGTSVLGVLASYAPGDLIGTAYDADYILCNAEDGPEEYYLEERWFVAALEFAESHGADIITSSLVLYGGYPQEKLDGKTSIMTQGMNIATENGVVCLEGAGNSGNDQDPTTSHLMVPADAKNVISVGAVNHQGKIARFSSDGPSKDGRLKPEVLALGTYVSTIALFDKQGYSRMGGTSAATPLMAGAVACILQVHPEWTVQEMRKALFNSGDFFLKYGKPDPLFVYGYGIPDVFEAANLNKIIKKNIRKQN